MSHTEADVVICGAGIAGIATAFNLAVRYGIQDVFLVDERPPMSLTSENSTECYRNWWPGPDACMIQMMNRSIDILEDLAEESGNHFQLNRRGYLFATADENKIEEFKRAGDVAQVDGAGPLRLHDGSEYSQTYVPHSPEGYDLELMGADLITDRNLIERHFKYLSEHTCGLLHVRRAGWLSAQQLGMYLLDRSKAAGVELVRDRLVGVNLDDNCVQSVEFLDQGIIKTPVFVNAAGPFVCEVAEFLDVDIPIFSERHLKFAFRDSHAVLPRDVPLLIWADDQRINWSHEELTWFREEGGHERVTGLMPSGVHTRPEGGASSETVLALWEYNAEAMDPVFPLPLDDLYPEVVLRGLCAMLPGMSVYVERMPRPKVDGGYYTRTKENRPLATPLPVDGAYLIGALSGFGIMSAPALGELVATQIVGSAQPEYAAAFDLRRYESRAYQEKLENWGDSWQI